MCTSTVVNTFWLNKFYQKIALRTAGPVFIINIISCSARKKESFHDIT